MTEIRPWREGDVEAVEALLDAEPDALWAAQSHRLHGPPREGERWRRTWVATRTDAVVGAVTLGRNHVHPSRYNCAVEVGPTHRRRGIGTALVEAARAERPERLPLSGRVREHDRAAAALLARVGGSVYQRSPVPAGPRSQP